MFRTALVGVALLGLSSPVWAFNDEQATPGGTPMGVQDGGAAVPGSPACQKAKRQLTPEQKAQRRALKAQRVAQGISPPPKAGSHRPKC